MNVDLAGELLARLPDIPRWVEARSVLLSGHGDVIGPIKFDPTEFIATHRRGEFVVIAGKPEVEAMRSSAARADEIIGFEDNAEWITKAFPEWTGESATLHVLPEAVPLTASIEGVRIMEAGTASRIPGLDPELAEELRDAEREGSEIAAAMEGDRPVAFCYAGSITETYWDVSIDTIEGFRRRGFAEGAARFMIDRWAQAGKRPIWGSLESNVASAGLARKLGFVAVDTIWVFERSEP
jgi:hypothetical protein